MCKTFVELSAQGYSVTEIAAALGVARQQFYIWKEDDKKYPGFPEAFMLGHEAAEAWWEKLGRLGTSGELKGFKPISYMYIMKCRFKGQWLEDGRSDKLEITAKYEKSTNEELNNKIKQILNRKVIDITPYHKEALDELNGSN